MFGVNVYVFITVVLFYYSIFKKLLKIGTQGNGWVFIFILMKKFLFGVNVYVFISYDAFFMVKI